jgi:hypothetical protein
MFGQNTPGILPDAQDYSCRFNGLAISREIFGGRAWTIKEYNEKWLEARRLGIISGDLNRDGDFDDEGEDVIRDDSGLIKLLELPLQVIPPKSLNLPMVVDEAGILRIAPTLEPIDLGSYWVLERWFLEYSHFVVGDGTGRTLPFWDPWRPASRTRAKGKLLDLRVFKVVKVLAGDTGRK